MVEGVEEGGVEGAEGEFGDEVREVEGCGGLRLAFIWRLLLKGSGFVGKVEGRGSEWGENGQADTTEERERGNDPDRREGKRRTFMAQMFPKIHIPMAPRRNMKIPLDLIPLQAPKNPTTIRLHPPSHLRRPFELPPPLPHLPKHMSHMRILLLQILSPPLILLIPAPMHFLRVYPHSPRRGILSQQIPREDAVAGGVLHVDVEVGTLHVHDGVEVYLQGM